MLLNEVNGFFGGHLLVLEEAAVSLQELFDPSLLVALLKHQVFEELNLHLQGLCFPQTLHYGEEPQALVGLHLS